MAESLKRQNARPSLFVRVQEERLMETYSDIKPYLVRLFTHALLLFISVRAYQVFQSSKATYQEFITLLVDPVVIDAKLFEGKCEDLEGGQWKSAKNVTFPNILKGCRCDNNLYIGQSCDYISAVNPRNEKNFKENCLFLDKLLKSEIGTDESEFFYNKSNIPVDFQSTETLKPKEFDYDNYNKKYGDNFYKVNNLTNQTTEYRRFLYDLKIKKLINIEEIIFGNKTNLKNTKMNITRMLQLAGSKNLSEQSKIF